MHGLRRRIKQQLLPRDEGLIGATRNLATELRIKCTRSSHKPFLVLRGRRDLHVNLGCGGDIRSGWINVDLGLGYKPVLTGDRIFIPFDLRRGLPLAPGSCSFIYSSHFFEHLEFPQGQRLFADCFRALRPGGQLRLALPDYRLLFGAYVAGKRDVFDLLTHEIDEPEHALLADYMTYIVYQHGEHRCIYDEERIAHVLRSTGFQRVECSSYQPGMDNDNALRRRYSFYTQAVK
jgi:predicted SAM-dependent methyltransferase